MNRIVASVVTVVVAIIAVTAVMVPITSTTTEKWTLPEWQYDDYKPVGDAVSCTGAVEIVDVGGTSYLHAKDVGEGTVTHGDGSVDDVTVHKARLDVFFMWGQSNAGMVAYDVATAVSPPPGTAYYFGTDTLAGMSSATIANPPQYTGWSFHTAVDEDGHVRAGDKMGAFCKAYYEGTGHKVYWIDGAVGGKSITTFHPTDGFVWEFGEGTLDKGIDAIDTDLFDYEICYYMWIQGESDSRMPPIYYQDSYRYLHRSIVDGKLGHTFKGGIISLLGARFVDRNDDFEALAREIPGLYIGASAIPFTVDNGLMADDNLHYTQAGDNIIGEELGKKATELMNRERQTDTGMASLIGTIPVIILAGLLMALAVGIVRRRDI